VNHDHDERFAQLVMIIKLAAAAADETAFLKKCCGIPKKPSSTLETPKPSKKRRDELELLFTNLGDNNQKSLDALKQANENLPSNPELREKFDRTFKDLVELNEKYQSALADAKASLLE
jgi:hypothetical protein